MKVLYAVRLFSGLETSVRSGQWQPTGVPTIYRVIEELADQCEQLHVVFCVKDPTSMDWKRTSRPLSLKGLDCTVELLGAGHGGGSFLANALREIRQAMTLIRLVYRMQPDVVYLDHGNVWSAGIIARLFRRKVVFRIMGVYPAMRHALRSKSIASRILRWCYRAPFATAICTQDGSGVEPWLKEALDNGVKVRTFINGVDRPKKPRALEKLDHLVPPDAVVVTFLGKLEAAKGIKQFTSAFLSAANQCNNLHALIIGTGSLVDQTKKEFSEVGAIDKLTMLENLPHRDVLGALVRTDIYVSLNRYGNLSNANLEAMTIGCAMIFPMSQPESMVDVATDELLPKHIVKRVESADDLKGVEEAILSLARDPSLRQQMAHEIRAFSAESFRTWDARIDQEIQILRDLPANA